MNALKDARNASSTALSASCASDGEARARAHGEKSRRARLLSPWYGAAVYERQINRFARVVRDVVGRFRGINTGRRLHGDARSRCSNTSHHR